jgi:hypothetical protein
MMRDIQRLLELFDWACRRKYLTHGDEIWAAKDVSLEGEVEELS